MHIFMTIGRENYTMGLGQLTIEKEYQFISIRIINNRMGKEFIHDENI